ncbi:allophanate hydrolase [Actinoplanes sp. NPDC051851]|uniref:allophanate hydrolase n=1 Tax=Actinoplanes sp. NPDC051851 TaxID=3154753 RepID=UPI003422E292
MNLDDRYARAAERPEAWITLRPQTEVQREVDEAVAAGLPLAGLVFAVKNNIDVAGIPTTAGCPAYAYDPARDATAVARLRAAGAVVLGATNLDQFATGLVGTRSPYGAVRHATDPARISGGSSSGSAVAVALGAADFALGTDTAGSGRVPAALHGLYGVKPTKGTVSAAGVVPACRSLDVVTVFAADLALARRVTEVMTGFDERDPLSRPFPEQRSAPGVPAPGVPAAGPVRIGVPAPGALGELDPGWAERFAAVVASCPETVIVDIEPLLAAARLLYEGALVAERYTAVGPFIDEHPDEVDPTVRAIIGGARDLPAWRLFQDLERIDGYRRVAASIFAEVDALLLPTTTGHPTLAAVAAEPVAVNTRMGRFTNFANMLDLAALAVPAGTAGGLPFGVQLIGPAFSDRRLASIAAVREKGFDL